MNLKLLQNHLTKKNIDAFFLPINDEFFSEFIPDHNKRLNWLTSFSGSYASSIITTEICHFFTDGRYLTQLKAELNNKYYNIYDIKYTKPWEILEKEHILWYDPKLVTKHYMKSFKCHLNLLQDNPVDCIWLERPNPNRIEIYRHEEIYSGESSISKCRKVKLQVPFLVTSPDSVSWLANIRANEVKYNPHVAAHAILYPDGKLQLFIQEHHFLSPSFMPEEHLEILSLSELPIFLANLDNLAFDDKTTSVYYQNIIDKKTKIREHLTLHGSTIKSLFASPNSLSIEDNKQFVHDICELPKACKNKYEIDGAISAHIKDGVAHIEFFHWLQNNISTTEIEASQKLLSYREKHDLFIQNSFETISAFAENSAIIHYHPTAQTNKKITKNNLYLLDSGGQYLNATTDITRTVIIGTATAKQKLHYTLVLKGLINLSTVIFPNNTSALKLDSLARVFLWKDYYDFPHGTGHGVGSFLSVHEGPQSFSSSIELMPGMIISNEPGYYLEGEYGIRLENLMYVHDIRNGFFCFKTLTLVPFEITLIDFGLLTTEEKTWLKKYHDNIFHVLRKNLTIELENFYIENYLINEKI